MKERREGKSFDSSFLCCCKLFAMRIERGRDRLKSREGKFQSQELVVMYTKE